MQIIELELSHFNFYCPVTGEYILNENEPCNEDALSLQGYWVDMCLHEPFIKNKKLEKDYNQFVLDYEAQYNDDCFDFESFENFLKLYPEPNWVVFKITHSGMACGPTSSAVWFVIDMNIESVDEL